MARRSSPAVKPPRPEVLAFLDDIKKNPDDDTPRLVLADWLEDHDDPRGEFVRLQCQHGPKPRRGTSVTPGQREAELLEKHWIGWLGVLSEKGIRAEFRRGMLQVRGNVRKLLSRRLATLSPAEELAWVDELCVYGMDAAAVAKLAESPHWTCLTHLDLSGAGYYADHLVGSYRVGMGAQGAVAVAELPVISHLSELSLRCHDIGAEGMTALAACPHLERLRRLNLSCDDLRDEGAAALASSRSLTGLTELHLDQNRMGAEGFAALAKWPGLARLTLLSLWHNYPSAEGAAALASSRYLGSLEELNLNADHMGAYADCGPYQIGSEGAAALSRSAGLKRLQRLFLSGNGIGPEGAAALADSRTLIALVELDLSENTVGDEGAVALAESRRLSRLTRLDLRYNSIGDRGALALAGSPHLSNLRSLNFRANRDTTPSALMALRDRFGDGLDNEQFDA